MSIEKIKKLASTLKSGKVLSIIKSTVYFGNTNIGKEIKELLDLIEDYKEPEPKVDVPLKPRVRRTRATKKETTT